jgi:HD-like signal output (HDOD) protein
MACMSHASVAVDCARVGRKTRDNLFQFRSSGPLVLIGESGNVTFILVGVAIVVAAIAFFMLKNAGAKPAAPAAKPRPSGSSPPRAAPATEIRLRPVPVPAAVLPMPEALQQFKLVRHTSLPASERDAIVSRLRAIPRPPRSLQKLVSPQFLAQATSTDLSDLMMGEPQIAARVLAMVNSPAYGLSRPLASIGQAATMLGMNSVRSICLAYMLDTSLKAESPALQRIFDRLWNASALASELSFKLAQLLNLPEPGALVSKVVLSYIGQLATYTMLPPGAVLSIAGRGLLARAHAEQAQLGLSAAEIGDLLLREWELPDAIVAGVRGIDLMLVTPVVPEQVVQNNRLALCYLCARLGELLASGEITDLAAFDIEAQTSPDMYHLRAHLAQPGLQRLGEFLKFPDVVNSVQKQLSTMRI